MAWKLISFSDAPAAPWRNGGGVTRELAAGPTREDWAWRISVADVTADGPFSHFPGVQRWFAVVRGQGVRLAVDGAVHDLVGTSAPLQFDGAAQVQSWLLAGPTQDLNLMVQRERASGVMTRVAGEHRFTTAAEGVVAVFALGAPASVRRHDDDSRVEVPPYSLAWARLPAGSDLEIASSGALCMEITSRQ
jgi:uncharacterized protein